MAEYIDRNGLIEALNKFAPEHYNALINQLITKYPTANVVEVKHGEWIPYPSDAYVKCSVCGMEYVKEKMPNIVGYCPNPNCGAKMDGRSGVG